ncbi:MAG: GtrA family protein [Gemmatimonadetes bacterium]|nr:GtrA family protein [Gemmatimonadota bacterium]
MTRSGSAQLRRFLVVGLLTVAVDGAAYRALLWAGVPVHAAKAAGFGTGSVFAYFANRAYTFGSRARGARTFAAFAGVYLATLAVNVAVNAAVLARAGRGDGAVALAFLCATATSATLNFMGMKHLVFRSGATPLQS